MRLGDFFLSLNSNSKNVNFFYYTSLFFANFPFFLSASPFFSPLFPYFILILFPSLNTPMYKKVSIQGKMDFLSTGPGLWFTNRLVYFHSLPMHGISNFLLQTPHTLLREFLNRLHVQVRIWSLVNESNPGPGSNTKIASDPGFRKSNTESEYWNKRIIFMHYSKKKITQNY